MILTFPDTPTTSQGLSLWCFNIVGGEILTFPDTSTTQGLSLWCFNIVAESTRPGYAESNHESNIFIIPTHYGDITLFYAPGGDSAISD